MPWITLAIAYGAMPLADLYLSQDWINPNKEESKELSKDLRFRIALMLSAISDWVLSIWILYYLITEEISLFNRIGVILVGGAIAATGITMAHEFNHKKSLVDKFFG